MRAVGVIPARLGSSRFPGKPLAPLLGRTMIEHVYRRTALSTCLADTCVATCDDEITVPIAPEADSLNVAAAAAVLLFALGQ